MKVTQWFPSSVLPAHKGPYNCLVDGSPRWFRFFDGKRWYGWAGTPKLALAVFRDGIVATTQHVRWRGLDTQQQ